MQALRTTLERPYMQALTVALVTTQVNSLRRNDLLNIRPGMTIMLHLRKALIKSPGTRNSMRTGKRCTTVPSGSTQPAASQVALSVKPIMLALNHKANQPGGNGLTLTLRQTLMTPRVCQPVSRDKVLTTLTSQLPEMSE